MATIKTLGNNPQSVLDNKVRSYAIHKNAGVLAKKRAAIFNQIQQDPPKNSSLIATNNELIKKHPKEAIKFQTVIDYDPTVFSDPNEVVPTLYTEANPKINDEKLARAWRHKSKHRTATSFVTCYSNGFGEDVSPFQLVVTSGCAPNLMGSSKADENQFIQNGKLNTSEYKKTMKLLFKRWLQSQDSFGVDFVIMPFVGGGVYLDQLKDRNEKKKAKENILSALKEALEESTFSNIKEVIFALPGDDDVEKNVNLKEAIEQFSSYEPKPGRPNLTAANVDVFEAAYALQKEGKRVGLINPGSDRTIGGGYTHWLDGKIKFNKKGQVKITLEELICNITDTIWKQAADYNKDNIIVYQPYLDSSLQANPKPSRPAPTPPKQATKQFNAAYNSEKLNVQEVIVLSSAGDDPHGIIYARLMQAHSIIMTFLEEKDILLGVDDANTLLEKLLKEAIEQDEKTLDDWLKNKLQEWKKQYDVLSENLTKSTQTIHHLQPAGILRTLTSTGGSVANVEAEADDFNVAAKKIIVRPEKITEAGQHVITPKVLTTPPGVPEEEAKVIEVELKQAIETVLKKKIKGDVTLYVPVNKHQSHWQLAIVNIKDGKITEATLWDSMVTTTSSEEYKKLQSILKNIQNDSPDVTLINANIQKNSNNCLDYVFHEILVQKYNVNDLEKVDAELVDLFNALKDDGLNEQRIREAFTKAVIANSANRGQLKDQLSSKADETKKLITKIYGKEEIKEEMLSTLPPDLETQLHTELQKDKKLQIKFDEMMAQQLDEIYKGSPYAKEEKLSKEEKAALEKEYSAKARELAFKELIKSAGFFKPSSSKTEKEEVKDKEEPKKKNGMT